LLSETSMSILNKLFQADEAVAPKVKKTTATKKVATDQKETPVKTEKKTAAKKIASVHHGDVLLRAVVTEKAGLLAAQNSYVFAVRRDVNKHQIAEAVETTYGVKPLAVNVITMPSKGRVRGLVSGSLTAWKKAIVTLPAGKRITVAEGV